MLLFTFVDSPQLFVLDGSKAGAKFRNLKNWSGAIGYGAGSGSPLSPSFNFCLEFAKSSQVFFGIINVFAICIELFACLSLPRIGIGLRWKTYS